MSDFVALQQKLTEAEAQILKLTEQNRDLSDKVGRFL